jgi:hypothetical protein
MGRGRFQPQGRRIREQVSIREHFRSALTQCPLCALYCLVYVVCGCAQSTMPRPPSRHGDGTFIDCGTDGFPRYRVIFPSLSLAETRTGRFRAEGLPKMPATLLLVLNGVPASASESLIGHQKKIEELPITVRCRIVDEAGAVLADSQAGSHGWNVAASVTSTELWHQNLRDIRVKNGDCFTIDIEVSGSDGVLKDLTITPVLQGGGLERL